MRAGGVDRIAEVVRAPAFLFAALPIIDPGMRVLVHEKRDAFSRDIAIARVVHAFALEGIPGVRSDGMRGRSYGQHVKNRVLTESVPARFEKTALRFPPMRKQSRMIVKHPAEISALVNRGRQTHDFFIIRKLLTRSQHAGQQERRVDRRYLAVPASSAAPGVQPVIEPTMKLLSPLGKKTQGGPYALLRLTFSNPFAFGRDTKRGQSKPGRRNARYIAMVFIQRRVVGTRAIRH